MYLLPLDEHAVERELGCSLRDHRGRILLRAGTRLTAAHVRSLRQRGFSSALFVDGFAPDLVIEDAVRDETRARATQLVQDTMKRQVVRGRLDAGAVRGAVDMLIDDLRQRSDLSLSVITLRNVDDYTFTHSVNVCIYALTLGTCLGLDRYDLSRLGVGALMHDVGKVNYTPLVTRRGPLTAEEFELIKQHTVDGFEILRHHAEVDLLSAHVAYQHHERLDGSGYPRGLVDPTIIRFARIVAVADVYDALTGDRPYRDGMPPDEAMRIVQELAGPKLDAYIVRRFAERVAVFPVGSPVLLTTGEVAVVVAQTLRGPAWPRVRLLADAELNPIEPSEVDLDDQRRIRQVLREYPEALRHPGAGAAGEKDPRRERPGGEEERREESGEPGESGESGESSLAGGPAAERSADDVGRGP